VSSHGRRHLGNDDSGATAVSGRSRKPGVLAAVASAALLAAALGLAACSGAKSGNNASTPAKVVPERIIAAPRSLLSATGPLADGTMWAVAGNSSVGLFKFNSASGKETGSVSVSQAARSVAETPTGVVAVALGTTSSGALDLMHGGGRKAFRTVSLPAPALQVVTASSGTDFYVLTAWPSSASVSIVSSSSGKIVGTVPAPKESVSVAAAPQQGLVYVLQRNGGVDDISIHGGTIESSFSVGDPGESIAVSPDGTRLYVLKGTGTVSNIAVVNAATGGIIKVLPAPSHCVQLVVSQTGQQLYEVVGSPDYGNIQVFGF